VVLKIIGRNFFLKRSTFAYFISYLSTLVTCVNQVKRKKIGTKKLLGRKNLLGEDSFSDPRFSRRTEVLYKSDGKIVILVKSITKKLIMCLNCFYCVTIEVLRLVMDNLTVIRDIFYWKFPASKLKLQIWAF